MKNLVIFFIKRNVLVASIIIAILIVGVKTLIDIPKEGFPHVALNKAVITTIYPGANARDVEFNVTIPLEEELFEVDGIDDIRSISKEGISIINIDIDEDRDERFFNKVYMNIDAAINRVSDLPRNIDGRPKLEQISSFDKPIIEISLSGNYQKIKEITPYLEKKLRKLDEISGVDIVGLPDDEVNILVNPEAARSKLIDLTLIAKAISLRNIEGTGGALITNGVEKKVVILSKYQNNEQLLNTNIRISPDGIGVKLKDIAEVKVLPKDMRLIVRNNGKAGVSLLLKKRGDADILSTVKSIRTVISSMKIPNGVSIRTLNDQSSLTRSRLKVVNGNALIGIILVTIILFLVLDLKTALWTAFGIPFSLLAAYSVFPVLGLSFNILAMGGFIIVIGMVVDDAIVIAEEISTLKENGMSSIDACSTAVETMWRPVLSSTGTTILAFSPLLSLGGFPGKFIWVIPLVVILVLLASLFEAYFLLPSHLVNISNKKLKKKAFIKKIENGYKFLLRISLKFKYFTVAIFVVFLGSSVFVAKNLLKKDTFPQESVESFYIKVTMPIGTTEESSQRFIKKVETEISKIPSHEIDGFSVRIGTHSTDQRTERGSQYNMATFFVYLTPFEERTRDVFEIMDVIKENVEKVGHEANFIFNIFRLGPPLGNGYEVYISSIDDDARKKAELELKNHLREIDGVLDIQDDIVEGNTEYNIVINYSNLESFGLSVSDIVNTLRIAFDGMIVTSNTTMDGTIDYRLRLSRNARRDVMFLNKLPVMNRNGELLDMSKIVKIEERVGRGEISRLNGVRTTMVYGSVDKKNSSPYFVLDSIKKKLNKYNQSNIEITYGGEAVESTKIFKNLKSAAIVAFIGIYLILSLILNSFKTPFVIILAIPFISVGVMWSLFFHGAPLSMFIGVSLIGLMGIIVNDAIVLVHKINQVCIGQKVRIELLVDGATSRLRAILLTTVTTAAGLLPTAYGIGGHDPMISPMCLALTYGLIFGTIVVLFLIPSLYLIQDKLKLSSENSSFYSKYKSDE